jgi:hypothetical protein
VKTILPKHQIHYKQKKAVVLLPESGGINRI